MSHPFNDSHEKVKRAKKHIHDLEILLEEFASSQLYTVTVEECTWKYGWLRNELSITIASDKQFRISAALIIGDALHNLRSALDILFHQVILSCDGIPDNHTKLPIRNCRKELEAALNGALEEKKITAGVMDFVLNQIKPYKAGNEMLWALRELNDRDKHKLLVPTFKMMCISGIYLVNEKSIPFPYDTIFTSDSHRRRLDEDVCGRHPTVHDKGKATTGIGFEAGVPFEGESIFPALVRISEEVTRTIEAFKLAGFV
jgi:hypothetical protein